MASGILQQAAIYGRVSTLTNQSVEMQARDLRQLAERRSFEVVREYFDEGVSGAKSSRPALDEMLADAKRGKFRVLLVWKLDRLGRSLAHLVRLLEDLRACNVELVSFSEGLDFTTTTGKLLYQVLSAFAEFERDCIRERVRAGMRNARAKGKASAGLRGHNSAAEDRKSIAEAYWCRRLFSASWRKDSILPSGPFSGARSRTRRRSRQCHEQLAELILERSSQAQVLASQACLRIFGDPNLRAVSSNNNLIDAFWKHRGRIKLPAGARQSVARQRFRGDLLT